MTYELGIFSHGRVCESVPAVAACRAAPIVYDLPGRQVGGRGRRSDDVATSGAGIGSLQRRATVLIAGYSRRPAAFKLSMQMQGIDEGAHGMAPAVRREHHCLSVTVPILPQPMIPTNIVSGIEIDRPQRRKGHDASASAHRHCSHVRRFDFGILEASSSLPCQESRVSTAQERPMTRYYFDIRDGEALYPDEEGMDLEDQRAAEIEAAKSLGDMARDLSPLDDRHHMAIEVRTKTGPIFQAAFIFEAAPLKH